MSHTQSNRTVFRSTKGFTVKKSHRIISQLFVAVASFAAVAGAQAQSSTSTSSDYTIGSTGNSYIGLNVGQAEFKLNNGTGLFSAENRYTSYNVYAGSYFNNRSFGFEVGYTDFGKLTRGGGTTKADGINLSLIGRAPLGNSFNLLGKIGTTYGRTDVSSAAGSGITAGSEIGFDWSYGVGAEYAFNPQWSGVLQYDEHYLKYPGSGRDRINITSLGARYRF